MKAACVWEFPQALHPPPALRKGPWQGTGIQKAGSSTATVVNTHTFSLFSALIHKDEIKGL